MSNCKDLKKENERRRKISITLTKYFENPENRFKTSDSHKKENLSEETRKRMSDGQRNRAPPTDYTREKMSISKKNNGSPSLETRKRISIALTNKPKTDEHTKKNRESHKNPMPSTRWKFGKARRGKKDSEERIKQKSERMSGEKHPMFGKHHTEKSKKLISESHKGEKCSAWRGGISFEPYCSKFDRKFKERVRAFFGRICVECQKTEKENMKRLTVHHVNYDKMMCCNDVKPLFVAVCSSCNSIANGDREYWEEHYTDIVNNKYGGKCYFTEEEMIEYKKGNLIQKEIDGIIQWVYI